MRTKTLILAAAALAAGLASSVAQSNVYSVNLVGYINTPVTGNAKYTMLVNPFDDGNGNQVTNLMASLPKQSSVLIWDNATAKYITANRLATSWSANFAIAQGRGFFVKNGGGSTAGNVTNLFVGSVNTSNSVALPLGYSLLGSPLAYAGEITTDTNIALGTILPKQSSLLRWDVPTQKYVTVNRLATAWSGTMNIGVGEGFFIKTPTNTIVWTQVLQ